ncbi:MAG: malonyl-ACP O-methyltransferase BioC [Candidatus Spyradenecus sp.]
MIETPLLINRFARAMATYEREATVQRHEAERLTELLGTHCHLLAPRILEIGCGTGMLSRLLMTRFAPRELVLNDLCPDMEICFANVPRTTFLSGDARVLAWPGPFDLIASASAVQWLGDLATFAHRSAAVLNPGGFIAISGFGPQTLRETAELTGSALSYPTREHFEQTFAEVFEPLATEHRLHTLTFPDAYAVLRHLKATGVTATGGGQGPWTRGRMEAFAAAYAQRFPAEDGGVRLTYETCLFVGRKRA